MIRRAMMRKAERALWHLRNGTFLYAVKRKLGKSAVRRKPKGNQYYGHVAEEYVAERQKQSWWHTEQDVMQRLVAQLPRGASVLDVPFGTGRFVPFYLQNDMKVSGLDISEEMLKAAAKALGKGFEACSTRTGDATKLPYADDTFDVVVSFRFLDTIVSFADAKRAIREFARVTRSTAILELCERKSSSERGEYPSDDDVMGGLLDEKELAAVLGDAGLRIIEKSMPIKDSGGWLMHAYVCEKVRAG